MPGFRLFPVYLLTATARFAIFDGHFPITTGRRDDFPREDRFAQPEAG
jgi:hypothetical protein